MMRLVAQRIGTDGRRSAPVDNQADQALVTAVVWCRLDARKAGIDTNGGWTMAQVATILADGVYFGEGPRWHEGRLWFSDFFSHAIKSVGVGGDVRIEVTTDDRPSGLGWLPDGRLQFVAMTYMKPDLTIGDPGRTRQVPYGEVTNTPERDKKIDGTPAYGHPRKSL